MKASKAQLLSVEGAAVMLGVSVSTVWRRARNGELRLQRVLGRTVIGVDEVRQLLLPRARGSSPTPGPEET